ncbi:B12-binding domain-containing radical SAM protein [Elusimicrobiota bacterium]
MNKNALVLLPVFWPLLAPISLASLKGYLKSRNISIDTFDLNNLFYNLAGPDLKKEWLISCNKKIEDEAFGIISKTKEFEKITDKLANYDTIAMSCYKSNFNSVLKFSKLLKGKNSKIKIIIGGPEITWQYFKHGDSIIDKYSSFVDQIVVGEGEIPLLNFIQDKSNDTKLVLFNEIKNSSDLPIPDYSGLDLSKYPRKNTIQLMFSRGCIRHCTFCSEKLLYKNFKTMSIEKMILQIRDLKAEGIKNFVFNDSMVNADLAAFETLLDEIIKNFVSIPWEAQIAVRSDMPIKLFEKMKQSGCYNLFVGLESGSDSTLKIMNKGFTSNEALEFFKKLKSHDLQFGISMIVGFPNESEQDFKETLSFLVNNRSLIKKIEQINPYVYYEGTELDRSFDYKLNSVSGTRVDELINTIKANGYTYSKSFINNLVEH